MTRKLLIVFGSGLFFAIVLLSSAWVIGGPDVMTRIEKHGGIGWTIDDDDDSSPTVTRNLAFNNIKKLTIKVPVTLEYTRGDKAEMVVSGSEKAMDQLRWENGELSMGGHSIHFGKGLKVSITAPQLPDLDIKGASDADLADLDQPSLVIETAGALDLSGKGKVQTVKIDSKGASDIDLSEVEATDADVRIAGAGDVDINASGKVDARIAGAGEITLHRKPTELTSKISGAGSIEHDY